MNRYKPMFEKLEEKGEIAFIPFTLIGDPNLETSMMVVENLIAGGADALELGIPFSDPVADGPTIQSAGVRAREAGVSPKDCLVFLKEVRRRHPDIPIGILIYVNLVFKPGLDTFYSALSECGTDSILIADVPGCEAEPFRRAAKKHSIQQVFIAPPNASEEKLREIAAFSQGYTYVVTRAGVTGADQDMGASNQNILAALKAYHAAPPVLGFGISTPKHVKQAVEMGACGAISGSAIVSLIEKNIGNPAKMVDDLKRFVREMKAATKKGSLKT